MAENPFYVPPPNVFAALMSGVQGYDRSQKAAQDAADRAAYQQVGQAIQNGGLNESALAQLFARGPQAAPMVAAAAALMKSKGENTGVFGTPIYGSRLDGSTALGVIDKAGKFRELDTGGITPTPGTNFIDTGTGYVPYNSRTGVPMARPAQPGAVQPPAQPGAIQPTARVWGDKEAEAAGIYEPTSPPQVAQAAPKQAPSFIPKDIAGAARQGVVGKGQGEAIVDLESIESKMPGLETVVRELGDLSNKATYTSAGRAIDWTRREVGAQPREAAVARARYVSMVDNQVLPLLRDTFGSAFTQKEGDTLRETLGDPNKSPMEKQAVLTAFIEQKRRDVQALRTRTGKPSVATPATGQSVDYLLKKYGQ